MTIQTIDAATYAKERAICDKAAAYWEANANYGRGGWSSLSHEKAAHPDYAACDNAMRGRVEQYEILRDLPERVFAYVGKGNRNGMGLDRIIGQTHPVTVWTGLPLGFCTMGRPFRSGWGHTKNCMIYARIGGREYVGRGQGEGMCVSLRETAESKRKRAI